MEVLTIIGFIIVLVVVSRQSGKIDALRKKVDALQAVMASRQAPQVSRSSPEPIAPQYSEVAGQQTVVGAFEATTPLSGGEQPFKASSAYNDEPNLFIEWVKEDWLLKLGALLILIGFGWFLSYAFLNNWIGPLGRISLGMCAGVALLVFGWWRMRAYVRQGAVFMVLGSTVILLTTYAGQLLYGFFMLEGLGGAPGLALMFISTAFVALASVQYRRMPLALASLLLAGIAPQLAHGSQSDYISLFAYLLIVVVGAIWITVVTGWRILTTAGLVLVTIYAAPYLMGSSFMRVDENMLLLFMFGFVSIFFLTNTAGILFARGREIVTDSRTAALNGIFLILSILAFAPDVWQSLMLAAWTVIFVVGGFLIYRAVGAPEPLYIYTGVGIAMLGTATAVELSGSVLTIAFTLEAVAVSLLAYVLLQDVRMGQRAASLLIIPGILSMQSIVARSWSLGVFHEDFFVLFLMAAALLGLGVMYTALAARESDVDGEVKMANDVFFIVGSAYAYILLWLALHAALPNDDTAVMISLVVYTVIGIVTYFQGLTGGSQGLKYYGGILLGMVVARLLLVDVWDMELTGRIITFLLIGALLMGTAFLGKLFKR